MAESLKDIAARLKKAHTANINRENAAALNAQLELEAAAKKLSDAKREWLKLRDTFTFAIEKVNEELDGSGVKLLERAPPKVLHDQVFEVIEVFCSSDDRVANVRLSLKANGLIDGTVLMQIVDRGEGGGSDVLTGDIDSVTRDAVDEALLELLRRAEYKQS